MDVSQWIQVQRHRNHCKERTERSNPEDQGVCCRSLSSRDVRCYTRIVLLTPLPEHDTDEDNNKRYAKMDEEISFTSALEKKRNAEIGRTTYPYGQGEQPSCIPTLPSYTPHHLSHLAMLLKGI